MAGVLAIEFVSVMSCRVWLVVLMVGILWIITSFVNMVWLVVLMAGCALGLAGCAHGWFAFCS